MSWPLRTSSGPWEGERKPRGRLTEHDQDARVLFVDKATGETIDDTYKCRKLLGVPYGTKGTVRPLGIPSVMEKYDVFIQSNSVNRLLDKGIRFLYEIDHV